MFTGSPKFAGAACWGGDMKGGGRGHTNCQPCAFSRWGREGGAREDDSEVIGRRLRHSDF